MAEWIGHVAWLPLPVAARIGEYVIGQQVVWIDDTPIRTLMPGNGRARVLWVWCYAADPRPYSGPGHPAVFYRGSADRKGERPRGHLEGVSGYLHTDAFAGYKALHRGNGSQPPQIIHVTCMAHVRRKIFEAFDAAKSPIAEQALRRIQELCAIEAEIKGKPADQRRRERQKLSKPLLDALHDRITAQRRRLSGKAPLGKAFQYALSCRDALSRYLGEDWLSIGNNLAEHLLRGIAISRKNFLDSDRGGERAAAIYTLIESAKLNGLDPEAYLAAVLDRMARGHPIDRFDELLPWNFQPPLAAAA